MQQQNLLQGTKKLSGTFLEVREWWCHGSGDVCIGETKPCHFQLPTWIWMGKHYAFIVETFIKIKGSVIET